MPDVEFKPIKVTSPEDRIIAFEKASDSIYTKYSPYDGSQKGILFGVRQPFIWTKITDSEVSKNLTKYDSQAVPIGSTIRDVERVGKFMISDKGLLFIGKQYLLQQQTAFNETRIYNPLSVLSATAAKGSTGLIERPVRFLPTDGTIGDMASSAILSILGLQSNSINSKPKGTAAAGDAISVGASLSGGANKGLIRFEGGYRSYNNFKEKWVDAGGSKGINFAEGLKNTLVNKFKSLFPSTVPYLNGTTNTQVKWNYRPEYPDGSKGAFESMKDDLGQLLSFQKKKPTAISATTGNGSQSVGIFKTVIDSLSNKYFGTKSATARRAVDPNVYNVTDIHRYYPDTKTAAGDGKSYVKSAGDLDIAFDDNTDGFSAIAANFAALEDKNYPVSLTRRVGEISTEVRGKGINYVKQLNVKGKAPTTFTEKLKDGLTLDNRGFSKARIKGSSRGTEDTYNTLPPFYHPRMEADHAPDVLIGPGGPDSSADIIFFYFFDLVNSIYIPFRATVSGISDLHSPDWEEVSYLGRADKLYIYKGFTRDVNFSFTVYANSLKELLPMWKRINYLVGLSRPSAYTSGNTTVHLPMNEFMVPPMVTFRLGDMYVDQPCVLKSIGVNIPDDATWETQRGNGQNYSYLKGLGLDFSTYSNDTIYQLPIKADITINMSLMEKARSLTSADHFFIDPNNKGQTVIVAAGRFLGNNPSPSTETPDPTDPNKIVGQTTVSGTGTATSRQYVINGAYPPKVPLSISKQPTQKYVPEFSSGGNFTPGGGSFGGAGAGGSFGPKP